MRTLLICHQESPLAHVGMARWLASWSDLAGVIILQPEDGSQRWKRVRREIRRIGLLRIVDVIAMRLYYKLFLAKQDNDWQTTKLNELCETYPTIPPNTPILKIQSPNSDEAEMFIKDCEPDVMLAGCKNILRKRIFTIPQTGTFTMHPGICPEYRNAHGCFWAMANGDVGNVGMTLLRIDAGIDTGPVFGYFSTEVDERNESHITIQKRMTIDNYDALAVKFKQIHAGKATSLDTTGRASHEWGQPWLTAYLRWKWQARHLSRRVGYDGHAEQPSSEQPIPQTEATSV